MSLQAKLGLPRGNQIVGWVILGIGIWAVYKARALTESSTTSIHAICTPAATEQPLSASIDGHISDICANIRHSYDLL